MPHPANSGPGRSRGAVCRRAAAVLAGALAAVAAALAAGPTHAGESPKPAAANPAAAQAKPVTTAKGPLGDLLSKWFAEGTAAGNEGDYYDNRDRGHSRLNTDPYPQLSKIEYTEDERKRNVDWALQGAVLPRVVFGNSSTSAGVTNGGSNPRLATTHPLGLARLYAQYTHNNIYVYPSHQDCRPGRNGVGGYGDVFPTNTPYLVISQGSSGSDQPFLRAIPLALAAFRPDVKKRLVETGLLAPTLQMILRLTSKRLADPAEYLTGKAHPTVLEGSWVDDLRMVRMAHDILPDDIPPAVRLRVVEEEQAVGGRDYFDLGPAERLGDTPCVLARIHRRRGRDYTMVVSAEASVDLNQRPLEFRWVVLRGDATRIRLKPMNKTGSVHQIVVPWHDRRPVAPGEALESNRVDIGVFVSNGKYYSAPAFITFLHPDDEARTYADDGRVLEIGYGLGTTEVSVTRWAALLDLFKADADGLGARLLKKRFTAPQIAAFVQASGDYRASQAAADSAQATSKEVQAARQKAAEGLKAAERRRGEARAAHEKSPGDETKASIDKAEAEHAAAAESDKQAEAAASAARKDADAATKAAADVLGTKREGHNAPIKDLVQTALAGMAEDPDFYRASAEAIAAIVAGTGGTKAAFDAARRRLVGFGLAKDAAGGALELLPIREGPAPALERLTRCEKALLEQFNDQILTRVVYGGTVTFTYKRNYVDPRLATPKTWRDVYRYSPGGECTGWTRYDGDRATEFNPWGLVVLEKDRLGRCTKARAVRYERNRSKDAPTLWDPGLLRQVPEPGVTEYEYADDKDWRGRLKTPGGAR